MNASLAAVILIAVLLVAARHSRSWFSRGLHVFLAWAVLGGVAPRLAATLMPFAAIVLVGLGLWIIVAGPPGGRS